MTAKLEAAGTIATKATYLTSGGITFFGYLTAQEFAALFGIVLGILTFITTNYINWYWRKKAHELELERIRLEKSESSEEEHRTC